ncbi:Hypothetical protein A7982_06557 [Minicystis rosea]|nr:Hypothetical protein A7982_06557 [Minicystis rosea]
MRKWAPILLDRTVQITASAKVQRERNDRGARGPRNQAPSRARLGPTARHRRSRARERRQCSSRVARLATELSASRGAPAASWR